MWTKIKKSDQPPRRAARSTFGVSRSKQAHQAARLLIPAEIGADHDRADIFHDGDLLAFHLNGGGEFALYQLSKTAKSKAVTIPRKFSHRLPFGTHDAEVYQDGDMHVLDLRQFGETADQPC